MTKALDSIRKTASKRKPKGGPETKRVLALPVLTPDAPDLTATYARPGGTWTLRPVQSLALAHIELMRGLVGGIGVGHGKTIVSMLAAGAVGAERPLLLVPSNLIEKTHRDAEALAEHFVFTPPRVESYSMLSQTKSSRMLEDFAPDLIICDEAHKIRKTGSARTKRVLRYARAHPECRFVMLSGTITARGLKDYVHLVELALRDAAPMPLEWTELNAWAAAVDVPPCNCSGRGHRPGCPDGPTPWQRAAFYPVRCAFPADSDRESYRARFITAPGVVVTEDASAAECSLEFRRFGVDTPESVKMDLQRLRQDWTTPSGEEVEDPMTLARHRRHLSQGFHYRWMWPDGPDVEWLAARSEWAQNVRRVLMRAKEGRDSPALLAAWCESGECTDPALLAAWYGWRQVKHRPEPPVEAIWTSEYLIDAVMLWLEDQPPTLVWCEDTAILDAFARRPVEVRGPGESFVEDGTRHLVLSRRAHGTGKNLQAWSRNLILSFPPNGAVLEQLVGRTHRPGQGEDEVIVYWFGDDRDVYKARRDALYVRDTTGARQKILDATWAQ